VDLWKAALLGIVQGLTEFFPVSSDGHLCLIGRWLHLSKSESGADFVSFLHVGTLLACFVAFRREIGAMLPLALQPKRLFKPREDDLLGHEARFVVLGSLATAISALPFLGMFEAFYFSKVVLVAGFALTGSLRLLSRWAVKMPPKKEEPTQGLLVGGAQMLAILPGLSRSCITVVTGLLVGLPAARVASLSFLLSVPAVMGAVAMEFLRHPPPRAEWLAIAVGSSVAFLVGLFAVRSMLSLVPRGRMHWFAPYVLLLALLTALTTS